MSERNRHISPNTENKTRIPARKEDALSRLWAVSDHTGCRSVRSAGINPCIISLKKV